MKTHSKRFTDAVTKLYTAYHEGKLNAFDCNACAVGSIVGNGNWFNNLWATDTEGKRHINQEIMYAKPSDDVFDTGYSVKELMLVERKFLECFDSRFQQFNKESQFKGLCAVVEYLCELEGIPNIMDYTALFETENDAPKRQLEEVFV